MMFPQMILFPMLLSTGLLEKVWNDPFGYMVDAIIFLVAFGVVVRFAKDIFYNIFYD